MSDSIDVQKALFDYAALLEKRGVLEGTVGSKTVSKDVQPLFTALHQVLAGGTLSKAPVVDGSPDKQQIEELDGGLNEAVKQANIFEKENGDSKFG